MALTKQQIEQLKARGLTDNDIARFSGSSVTDVQQRATEPSGFVESAVQTVKNIPRSATNLVKDVGTAVFNPIDTATALGKTGLGYVQKLTPQEEGYEKYADATNQFFKERYGSVDAAKRTLINDPVGFLGDVSSIFTLGGGAASIAARAAGNTSRIGSAVSKAGQTASRIGEVVDPVRAGAIATSKAVSKIPGVKAIGSTISRGLGSSPETVSAASRIGVDIPAGAKSIDNTRATSLVEGVAARTFATKKVADMYNRASDSLVKASDDIVSRVGKLEDMSTLGEELAKSSKSFAQNLQEIKNALYEQAKLPSKFAPKSKQIIVAPTRTLEFLRELVRRETPAAGLRGKNTELFNTYSKLLKNIEARNKKGDLRISDFDALHKSLNREVGSATSPFSGGATGELKKLLAQMDGDIFDSLEKRPDLRDAVVKAKDSYIKYREAVDSVYAQKIFKFADEGQYDKIAPAIINKNMSADDVSRIYEMIGEENVPKVRAALLDDIFTKARNDAGDGFRKGALDGAFRGFGDRKLAAIFGEDNVGVIEDLRRVARNLEEARGVALANQNSSIVQMVASVGALIGTSLVSPTAFLSAAAIILGGSQMSKLIASPTGQKLISEGLSSTRPAQMAGQAVEAVAPAVRPVGMVLRGAGQIQQNAEETE